MSTPEELAGQGLRRLRVARGWSQAEVAYRMAAYGYEWHQTLIGRIETAQRPLRLNEAVDLAELFGVSLQALLMRTGPDVDPSDLRGRIEMARRRLKEAETTYQRVHDRWDNATAQLAPLGQEDSRAREVVEAARGELSALVTVLEHAESQPSEPPS